MKTECRCSQRSISPDSGVGNGFDGDEKLSECPDGELVEEMASAESMERERSSTERPRSAYQDAELMAEVRPVESMERERPSMEGPWSLMERERSSAKAPRSSTEPPRSENADVEPIEEMTLAESMERERSSTERPRSECQPDSTTGPRLGRVSRTAGGAVRARRGRSGGPKVREPVADDGAAAGREADCRRPAGAARDAHQPVAAQVGVGRTSETDVRPASVMSCGVDEPKRLTKGYRRRQRRNRAKQRMNSTEKTPPSSADSARLLARTPNPWQARRRNHSSARFRRTFNNSNACHTTTNNNNNVNRFNQDSVTDRTNDHGGRQFYSRRYNHSNSNMTMSGSRSGKTAEACPSATAPAREQPASSSTSAFTELNNRQVERLRTVLHEEVEIHGKENFPTLRIALHKLISHVRRKLRDRQLALKHVKLNGGAASYVMASEDFAYSDLDLIFPIDLSREGDFDKVRCAVFDALIELMPPSTNKQMLCVDTLKDIYIRKMVKVSDGDRWSLFSLHNNYGRCIELKFVDNMRRQFEFSVDSFQITLDALLDAEEEVEANTTNNNNATNSNARRRLCVGAESMFGDLQAALKHLNRRLIDTRNPEEIRGGGLLKYCHLLCKGYTATANCREMEKYMCSRFFIDFSDIGVQELKLRQYLDNHFGSEEEQKIEYLKILNMVIKESTVCLMSHERRSTQTMIERLRQQISYNIYYQRPDGSYEHTPRQVLLYLPQNSNHWIRVV